MPQSITTFRLVISILWPAFLMACVSSGVVFSIIDPSDLPGFDERFDLGVDATYTVGFLLFWFLGCVASTITAILLTKPR